MVSANDTAGSGVREMRRAAGLSQQRLAGLADCSVSMVRLVESGYRPDGPSAVIERISSVLNDVSPAGEPGSRETSAGGDGRREAA